MHGAPMQIKLYFSVFFLLKLHQETYFERLDSVSIHHDHHEEKENGEGYENLTN